MKEFEVINVGKDPVDLSHIEQSIELRPTKIYWKEDGALDDTPSLTIIMERPFTATAIGQITLNMLNEGLAEIGYKVVKNED